MYIKIRAIKQTTHKVSNFYGRNFERRCRTGRRFGVPGLAAFRGSSGSCRERLRGAGVAQFHRLGAGVTRVLGVHGFTGPAFAFVDIGGGGGRQQQQQDEQDEQDGGHERAGSLMRKKPRRGGRGEGLTWCDAPWHGY